MKWLKWSSIAVSLVALSLIAATVVVFRSDVNAAVQEAAAPVPALPAMNDAPDPGQPSPSNEISEFQQLD